MANKSVCVFSQMWFLPMQSPRVDGGMRETKQIKASNLWENTPKPRGQKPATGTPCSAGLPPPPCSHWMKASVIRILLSPRGMESHLAEEYKYAPGMKTTPSMLSTTHTNNQESPTIWRKISNKATEFKMRKYHSGGLEETEENFKYSWHSQWNEKTVHQQQQNNRLFWKRVTHNLKCAW